MKYLPLAAVILLLLIPAYPVHAQQSGEDRVGDWVINEDTLVEGEDITLQGNLYIRGGGLELVNSTLSFRLYSPGQFRLYVSSGYLHLKNSTIEAYDPEYPYFIYISKGAVLHMESSRIEGAGYGSEDTSGLYTEGRFEIRNSTFSDCNVPLWAENVRSSLLFNTTFSGNSRGPVFSGCSGIEILDSTVNFQDGPAVYLESGHGNTISGCIIAHIYGTEGRGVDIANESGDTITGNLFNRTSREGVLIEGEHGANNTVSGNSFIINGVAQVRLKSTANDTVKGNSFNTSYMGLLAEYAENIAIEDNSFGNSVAVKMRGSRNISISGGTMRNIRSYAVMAYSSDDIMLRGISIENATRWGYFRNSSVISDFRIDPAKYYILKDARLYFAKEVNVSAVNRSGVGIEGVDIGMSFLGRELLKERTDASGRAVIPAPYVLQTPSGRNYSWCEVSASGNTSFEENPIRFYSWENLSIEFRESAPGLMVGVSTDRKEAVPGDYVNITVTVIGDRGYVNDAKISLYLNGKEVFPPVLTSNGTYTERIKLGKFDDSLKIEAVVKSGSSTGTGYTTVMKVPKETGEIPSEPSGSSKNGLSWLPYAYLLSAALLIAVLLLFLRKRRKRAFHAMMPAPSDRVEIKRR